MLRFLFSALGLVLAGCATVPEIAVDDAASQALWQQHRQQLEPFNDWSIRGRVVVFVEDEVYHLGLSWRREGDSSSLKFEASMGQGLMRLEKLNGRVVLTTAEGETYQGRNAQQVLYDSTGLTIPVEGLETWIKGLPRRDSAFEQALDTRGRSASLQQDGWFINYLDYLESDSVQSPRAPLPRRLYLKHNSLALKIVIDQWQNPAAPADAGLFPSFPN